MRQSLREIECGADKWAKYQYNHPQKKVSYSQGSKERFVSIAIKWLGSINLLEDLPGSNLPILSEIYERKYLLARHANAPLLKERLAHLSYWSDNGATLNSLRRISYSLLMIVKYLKLNAVRTVSLAEIKQAAKSYMKEGSRLKHKRVLSEKAKRHFICDARRWFEMMGCLKKRKQNPIPFGNYLSQYIDYMRNEQGLSENTIEGKERTLRDFLDKVSKRKCSFKKLTPLNIDKILIEKHTLDSYSRRTIQTYSSTLRSFISYGESQGWVKKGLSKTIKSPRVYAQETLPYSPTWADVNKMLSHLKTNRPADIRDYAILMLLSVYGLRCSEVRQLCLKDIDWEKEVLHVKRAKLSKPQTFPLAESVGNAIIEYVKTTRPNQCGLKELFLCTRAPYRPLKNASIDGIVSRHLKSLSLQLEHYGPHALRHACATHLINEGISLKEISEHLGHKTLETTRIYTKVDLANLRKVADFGLGDVL